MIFVSPILCLFILPKKAYLWYDWIKHRHQKHWNWASARNRIQSSGGFNVLHDIHLNIYIFQFIPLSLYVHYKPESSVLIWQICVCAFAFLYIHQKCIYIFFYLFHPQAEKSSLYSFDSSFETHSLPVSIFSWNPRDAMSIWVQSVRVIWLLNKRKKDLKIVYWIFFRIQNHLVLWIDFLFGFCSSFCAT